LRSATVTPSQKVDEIPTLAPVPEAHQNVVSPSARSHRKILISILLVGLLLLGIIAFSSFEYLNRSTPDRTLGIFCKALQSKDYQSIYDQLSIKLQGLGSEKLIADNLSNVKDCTYQISKESENFVAAKITFIGLSGQLVSGTMILIKDSNNIWKVDDLQNI
jgi:hypothetical protein